MSDNTPDISTLPSQKKSHFNKTNAIRVFVAATAVAVAAVVFVKLKGDSSSLEEIVETVKDTIES